MTEVLWREWGEDAFDAARSSDKPILLDIGAVWCHWCHVMDHGIPDHPVHTGTYSDPQIAATINRDFIPVKVDNDRRPDINARYNMGGWPTTAFLTPDGDPLYGATYLTPSQMSGLLEQISQYYRDNKDEITERLRQFREKQLSATAINSGKGPVTEDIIDTVCAEITRNFDPAFGGFGVQPKFPHPDALNLALTRYALTGDADMKQVAERTLYGMASGGMYDVYAGGFFRYSTTRDWSVPHFEKMLQDNTRLLSTNVLAYRILRDERFLRIAEDVARFLFDVLYDPALGTFAGSQDADKEEEYYGLPLIEREKLPTPFIDKTVYLGWNSLAVTALVDLYGQTGDENMLSKAVRLYDFLTTRVAPRHYFAAGKAAGIESILSDNSALLSSALDLYESTGVRRFLDDARGLADTSIIDLYVDKSEKFRDFPELAGAIGALNTPKFDLEENAQMCQALLRLTELSSSSRYRRIAETVLASFEPDYATASYFASAYALAAYTLLSPTVHVVIVGELNSLDTRALKLAALSTFRHHKVVDIRQPGDSEEYLADPDGRSIAYVCIDTTCSRPTADPSELVELLTA